MICEMSEFTLYDLRRETMTWLLIVYLVGLFYLALNQKHIASRSAFCAAWTLYALIPASNFLFTLIRLGSLRNTRTLAVAELWSNGIQWLLLSISLFCLLNAFMSKAANASRE